jgi:hypothetical protein
MHYLNIRILKAPYCITLDKFRGFLIKKFIYLNKEVDFIKKFKYKYRLNYLSKIHDLNIFT